MGFPQWNVQYIYFFLERVENNNLLWHKIPSVYWQGVSYYLISLTFKIIACCSAKFGVNKVNRQLSFHRLFRIITFKIFVIQFQSARWIKYIWLIYFVKNIIGSQSEYDKYFWHSIVEIRTFGDVVTSQHFDFISIYVSMKM
jgi:hypothetical protein